MNTSRKKSVNKRPTRSSKKTLAVAARKKSLGTLTDEALQDYFRSLNGQKPGKLYQLVLEEVEKPLFKSVLDYTNGNQSEAAAILGINRGTLRKKLKTYKLVRR